ncbi:hypothetical protein [Nocardia tengchongensis]
MTVTLNDQDKATLRNAAYGAVSLMAAELAVIRRSVVVCARDPSRGVR